MKNKMLINLFGLTIIGTLLSMCSTKEVCKKSFSDFMDEFVTAYINYDSVTVKRLLKNDVCVDVHFDTLLILAIKSAKETEISFGYKFSLGIPLKSSNFVDYALTLKNRKLSIEEVMKITEVWSTLYQTSLKYTGAEGEPKSNIHPRIFTKKIEDANAIANMLKNILEKSSIEYLQGFSLLAEAWFDKRNGNPYETKKNEAILLIKSTGDNIDTTKLWPPITQADSSYYIPLPSFSPY